MTVTRDATSGWALPQNATEWTSLLNGTGIANPSNAWPAQVPSGNLLDVIGSVPLVRTGATTYSAAVPGWSSTGISFAAGAGAYFLSTDPTMPDGTGPFTLLCYYAITSTPAGERCLALVGDSNGMMMGANVNAGVAVANVVVDHAGGFAGPYSALGTTSLGTTVHPHIMATDGGVSPTFEAQDTDAQTLVIGSPQRSASATKAVWLGAPISTQENTLLVYAALWPSTALTTGQRATLLGLLAPITVTSVTVSPSSATIATAGTVQLAATAHYSDSSTADVTATATWNSNNGAVATVSSTGLVTGVSGGTTNITATFSAQVGSSTITDSGAAVSSITPTFTMVAHAAPVSGSSNMLAQVSVGTLSDITTAPPGTFQTGSGRGIHPVPGPITNTWTDIVTNIGGTRAQLQAGGGAFKWVFAIEGYPYLLTDANTDKAALAWSGTDYTRALDGLFVELDNEQAINPHDPFANSGGQLTVRVQPDATDTFGIDTNRRAAGAEAKVIRTLDRAGASITNPTRHGNDALTWQWISVDNGLGFVAGDAWIGTECLTLSGPGQNNVGFTARGKYTPFASGGTGGARFAQYHRVAADSNGVSTNPLLTQQPRTWIGRMVGLWMHTVSADGTLNAKSDAQCVFAGRIAAISDDAATGFTSVQCTHVLDAMKSTTIGRDLWTATVAEGVYITAGRVFTIGDNYTNGTSKTGNSLAVVASGATGTNQINAGWYTLEEICTFINTWLGAETVAGRINGSYKWDSPALTVSGYRTRCGWQIAGVLNGVAIWALTMPSEVAALLGLVQFGDQQAIAGTTVAGATSLSATQQYYFGANPPMRETFTKQLGMGSFYYRIAVENERGVLQNQYATLPVNQKPPSAGGLTWGAFLLNGKYVVLGARDPSTSDTTLTNIVPINLALPGAQSSSDVLFSTLGRTADDTNAGPMTITQLLVLESTFAKMLKMLAYSTGTAGYNHPTYDTLGYGLGLGLPNDILGAAFEQSIDRLPGAQLPLCITVDKPLTFAELVGADLLLRRAFPIWRNGHIEMSQWTSPTSDLALISLDEGNKAEPAASISNQRSATILTDEWMKNVVQIHYNRDITNITSTDYQNSLTLEDQRSVDDSGGLTSVLDISARNTFAQLALTGSGVETLAPGYLALMPLFSQPVRKSTRSIDLRYFEGYAPGDQVLVTDKFMRDPATGQRGVSARAAIITRLRYNPGGPTAGNPDAVTGMQGEVDVFFLDLHRYGAYAPVADVDTSAHDAGFVNGYRASTLEIRLLSHGNSETGDISDWSRFKAGDSILIQEIDPDDPNAALSWSRRLTVAPSGGVITIDQALVGYVANKSYRVTYDHYSRCQGLQQAAVFQAAVGTGRIENVGYAYEWAATAELADTTANGVADVAELMPALAYGDGRPLDVGNERGMLRAINAMIDYKAARCSPSFFSQTTFLYLNAPNFLILMLSRVYLGAEKLSNSVIRYLSVAPLLRVTSDGTTGQIRITLSRSRPSQLSGTSVGSNQIQFNDQFDQVTFDAGTSSQWWTPSPQLLTVNVKDTYGYAWLTIERIGHAECRGLAQCQEGPRVISV